MQKYCHFFQTLHDETIRTGYLGQGTHYSILRAVVFHDPMGARLPEGRFADFAVIWDADHDVRVIEPIEEIYRRGLLSSFLMFGEHRGAFTAMLSNKISAKAQAIPFNPVFLLKADELELSVRSANCLKNDNVVYVGDLVQKTEDEMLRTPNFGRKSVGEIKEVLVRLGLHLGMEIPGWPLENAEELADVASRIKLLETKVEEICQALRDPWTSTAASVENARHSIIDDDPEKVGLYLKNLEMLWQLGLATAERQKQATTLSNIVRRIPETA